jgi:hypothetical protein
VGGGASRLGDALLAEGFRDISVLDIAGAALDKARQRLGASAARVQWLTADVSHWRSERRYRLWHDRALFHFLTEAAEREAYHRVLESALAPGGIVVMASFALDGPERCSGLPVQRYSSDTLAAELGSAFRPMDQRSEEHPTPAGKMQRFQYSMFRFQPQ